MKPTIGLVSRHGIIPISAVQDTAGPMTRSVADAAALLSVLAGPDDNDAATAKQPAALDTDYTGGLSADGLRGARIGVLRSKFTALTATPVGVAPPERFRELRPHGDARRLGTRGEQRAERRAQRQRGDLTS